MPFNSLRPPIDLLYVDGAHGYAPALSDITGWGVRVEPGGTMAIHDVYTSLFVTLAVVRSLWFSAEWIYVGRVRSLAVYQHRDVHGVERLGNIARQVVNVPWFVKNLAVRGLGAIGLTRLAAIGHAAGGGSTDLAQDRPNLKALPCWGSLRERHDRAEAAEAIQ